MGLPVFGNFTPMIETAGNGIASFFTNIGSNVFGLGGRIQNDKNISPYLTGSVPVTPNITKPDVSTVRGIALPQNNFVAGLFKGFTDIIIPSNKPPAPHQLTYDELVKSKTYQAAIENNQIQSVTDKLYDVGIDFFSNIFKRSDDPIYRVDTGRNIVPSAQDIGAYEPQNPNPGVFPSPEQVIRLKYDATGAPITNTRETIIQTNTASFPWWLLILLGVILVIVAVKK